MAKTKVIFRKFKSGELIALFPQECGSHWYNVSSYQQCGQHGTASMELVRETKLARPDEYKELKKELRRIGYQLKVGKRITSRDCKIRRDAYFKNN